MPRIVYIAAFAIFAVLVGLMGMNLLSGPVEARRESLAFRLENAQSGGSVADTVEHLNYDDLQYAIAAKPDLWAPLTEAAKAAAKPPDLEKILQGVSISRNTVGSGADVKIKIMTPENRAGEWVAVGSKVRGLTVKSIDGRRGSVVFVQPFQGREYAFTLTR